MSAKRSNINAGDVKILPSLSPASSECMPYSNHPWPPIGTYKMYTCMYVPM